MKEARAEKPISASGQALNHLASDAEFENYFKPLMAAKSKWQIEYNIA